MAKSCWSPGATRNQTWSFYATPQNKKLKHITLVLLDLARKSRSARKITSPFVPPTRIAIKKRLAASDQKSYFFANSFNLPAPVVLSLADGG